MDKERGINIDNECAQEMKQEGKEEVKKNLTGKEKKGGG